LAGAGAHCLAGSDLAPRILDVAGLKLRNAGFDVDLRSGDAESGLPWDADTFDVATLTGVLHHFYRPAAAMKEIRRVLRPGGRLIVADACFVSPVRQLMNLCLRIHPHEGDCRFYAANQASDLLRVAGFEVVRSTRLNWWAYGLVALSARAAGAPAV
jgi:ubiquinone/menaquinone biosynthesis C-methylase UbiE